MARRALVIGIGSYKDGRLGPLEHTASDAGAIAELLRGDPSDPNAWQVDCFIVSETSGTVCAAQEIRSALEEHLEVRSHWGENADNLELLIYFSGHATDGAAGMELQGFDREIIGLFGLAGLLKACKARALTLMLDCCYAGNVEAHADALKEEFSGSLAIFAACSQGEKALALENQNGLYSYQLVAGLGADLDLPAGTVTAGMLAAYVDERFPDEYRKLQQPSLQQPFQMFSGDGASLSLVTVGLGDVRVRAEQFAARFDRFSPTSAFGSVVSVLDGSPRSTHRALVSFLLDNPTERLDPDSEQQLGAFLARQARSYGLLSGPSSEWQELAELLTVPYFRSWSVGRAVGFLCEVLRDGTTEQAFGGAVDRLMAGCIHEGVVDELVTSCEERLAAGLGREVDLQGQLAMSTQWGATYIVGLRSGGRQHGRFGRGG